MENIAFHHWTPVLISRPLSKLTQKSIFLKMECYQPVGSFKIRGIGRLCQEWVSQGKALLVSSSGGNAGYATAYAGRKLGVNVTVFLPSTSDQLFIDAIASEGATVIIHGDVWDQAHQAALEYAQAHNGGYVPPFDHPTIWEGHSTLVDEVVSSMEKPETIVVSVGGGGLACGILKGLARHGWNDVPLICVETQGSASFAAALKAKQLVTLPKIDTIATSLGAKRVSAEFFAWHQKHTLLSAVVSDHDCALACARFADDHRALVEPSCGAALSTIYNQHPQCEPYHSILVIVCGGVGISLDKINTFLKMTR